jgi:serine/threonine-protein kinase
LIQLALPLQVGDSLDIERGVPVRPAISPDGRLFVYASRRDGLARLYRRGLDQLTATPIPGTEGAAFPFFSPDGQWIGFWADAAMKKVAVAGGAPIVVTSARTQSAGTWGDDDSIVFAEFTTGGGVLRVPAAGGNAQAVTRLAPSQTDNNHVAPHVLPGGRVVLYSVHSSAKMMAITLATGTQKEVTEGYWPQYLRSGHLVFVRGTSLWAVPFDPKRVELTGTAVRLLDGVIAGPAIGRDGTLVYLSGVPGGVQLVWVDRQGREEPVDLPPAAIQDVALSRGGRQLATSHGVWPEPLGIWIYDIARKTSSKLTTERGLSVFPLWSPDGAQVLYGSTFAGPRNVYRRSADGAGQAVRLTKLDIQHSPWGWSKDGRTLVIQLLRPQTSWDVASVPADGGDATMLVETPGLDLEAAVSPDGRWIAYSSNASGTYQIFVRPFPKVNETSWPISTAGGREARWSRDGRELFYREGQAIMRVPIEAGSTFAPGRPELVLKGNYLTTRGNKAWDVGPDGRFLMMKEVSAQYSVNVVLGWMDDLKARVPVGQ